MKCCHGQPLEPETAIVQSWGPPFCYEFLGQTDSLFENPLEDAESHHVLICPTFTLYSPRSTIRP